MLLSFVVRVGDAPQSPMDRGQAGLYDTLVRHMQSTALHTNTQDWLIRRARELADYCNELCDVLCGPASGSTFKSSVLKKDAALRFTSTNLHVEVMTVSPAPSENTELLPTDPVVLRRLRVRVRACVYMCARLIIVAAVIDWPC